ncbi:ABC transporter substrate-binding protein [Phyllobacterium salinisoli]|uniref:ABC transporter substrate-binding protein n=1 Tax=Phyllobacterium salinisoli TaxID=1899321 RepID=A0A368K714_9HYPH|nr:extracellular solute-binding protein [Phyllobacterium salinisoli]RCS25004.1 ABC transporter substrate-binding protein [Phyllobacterium salinisoli]
MTTPMIDRRSFLSLSGSAAIAAFLPGQAFADARTDTPLRGLSAFGELKYPVDFTHFEYASPDAPKGGTFTFGPPNWLFNQSPRTFNTLNSFSNKGDAPPRMELCFDSLMTSALDEPDAIYGLVAESVTISHDRNSFTFKLRPEARFSDGTPLTADDVAFTYLTFKEKGHPDLLLGLNELKDAVAEDAQTLRLTFSGKHSARAILDAATMPILSKAWYADHDFSASTLEPPPGSGPYKVGRFSPAQFIEYERNADYWARDLAVNRGLNHFDRIRIEFYRDRQPEFEAFKKGELDWRWESSSKFWATEYNFPAIQEKKVVKRTFPREKRPSMQSWAVNQRRERFRDPRVREAIALCFDFEWTNKNLFYDIYKRSQSCFGGSDFEARGKPSADELAILERYRGRVPEAIFGEVVTMPVSDGSGRDRKLFRRAIELMTEAGFKRENGRFSDKDGRPFDLELLTDSEGFIRIYNPFVQNLRSIGFNASVRLVDPVQYQARTLNFDFDMMGMAVMMVATPTQDSLSTMFSSRSAGIPGTRNYPGTADPVIDALVEEVGKARSRAELVPVLQVLDRLLRLRRDWIPNWTSANHLVAYWDRFGFKEPKPDYGFPIETLWWVDEEKARALGKA